MNKRIRTGLIGIALAGGTVLGATQIGGVANAQEDTTTETTVVEQADVPDGDQQDGPRQNRRVALSAVADLVGIEAEDLRTQLRDGATLADIAVANGVEAQAVVDLIVTERTEQVEVKVTEGQITQEEADEKLAGLEESVATRVEEGRPEGERSPRPNRRAALGGVAELIGVDAETLRTEIRGGATVAEIAEANGVASTDVVDLIVTERTERIDQAVIDGRLTQEEADEKVAGLEEQATNRVEQGRPEGERGPRGNRGPQAVDAAEG